MAATGFTPISLYYSTTASTAPTSGNLVNGELAINITDGKLYYKDNAGVVQTIASKTGNVNVSSFSAGTTGLTPSTATTGVVTLAGTLNVSSGGTGQTTLATGSLGYGQGTSAHAALAIGTAGQVLTVNSGATAPQWVNASSIIGGAGGSNTQVQYNSSGLLAGSANMTFDGSTLTTLNSAYTGTFTGGTGIVNLGSGQFYKDASGNVGIGTASPAYKLEVSGSAVRIANGSNGSAFNNGLIFDNTASASPNNYLPAINWNTGTLTWATIDGFRAAGGGYGGDLRFSTMNTGSTNTERMRIDSSGNLLVGTTATSGANTSGLALLNPTTATVIYLGHPTGTATGSAYMGFLYNGTLIGSITQSGTTAVLYNLTSDARLKTNIVDAPLGNIDNIKVRSFDWKSDGSHVKYGFIAQELVEVAPYAVHQPQNPEEMMAVDYSKLVPMMIKEIQDLKQRIKTLEAK